LSNACPACPVASAYGVKFDYFTGVNRLTLLVVISENVKVSQNVANTTKISICNFSPLMEILYNTVHSGPICFEKSRYTGPKVDQMKKGRRLKPALSSYFNTNDDTQFNLDNICIFIIITRERKEIYMVGTSRDCYFISIDKPTLCP